MIFGRMSRLHQNRVMGISMALLMLTVLAFSSPDWSRTIWAVMFLRNGRRMLAKLIAEQKAEIHKLRKRLENRCAP
jgi:hypothetical protein